MAISTTINTECPNCDAARSSPIVCDDCCSLFPVPPTATYFDLLVIPPRFALDEAALLKAYRNLTRRIHPDRFGGATSNVSDLATRRSAQINEAYGVLCDPLRRANYLLTLAGGPSAAETRDVPGNLLAEIMTLREEIDQACNDGDTEAIARHRNTITERRQHVLEQVANWADRLDACDENERVEFRKQLNSIKYFDNLLTQLTIDPLAEAGQK